MREQAHAGCRNDKGADRSRRQQGKGRGTQLERGNRQTLAADLKERKAAAEMRELRSLQLSPLTPSRLGGRRFAFPYVSLSLHVTDISILGSREKPPAEMTASRDEGAGTHRLQTCKSRSRQQKLGSRQKPAAEMTSNRNEGAGTRRQQTCKSRSRQQK